MSPAFVGKTLLNQYHVEEYISSTPLGEFYRATDGRNNKSLGLTLLAEAISHNTDVIKELEAKAAKLQGISHPNLVKYLGLYQTPTLAFLLEEWVDGPSLRSALDKAPVPISEALFYAKAVCNALDVLHKQSYLHLHLAPELIHIAQRGEILVGGLANAYPVGSVATRKISKYPPIYTSPEHLRNQPLDSAADIYALAVLLYELITGAWINGKRAPKTNDAIINIHLAGAPPAPNTLNQDIPDHFSRMLLWALRRTPGERFKTTTELLSSLALAARVSVDEIPLRVKPTTESSPMQAPVTSAILGDWHFLPPAQPNILSKDSPPLEDRLVSLAVPKKKKNTQQSCSNLYIHFVVWFYFPVLVCAAG